MSGAAGALLRKYETLLRLRAAHEEATAKGERPAPPLSALRALAAEFPGSLAELERLPTAELAQRVAELARAGEALPRWALAWVAVHDGLRGALALKRWLAGRRAVDPSDQRALEAALERGEISVEAGRWSDRLAEVASPKGGRLVLLVHERVAQELGVSADEIDALLFTPSRR